MPPECEGMEGSDLIEQVCAQVHHCEQRMATDRAAVGEDRFLTVRYDDVCSRPGQELERMVRFLRRHGVPARIARPVRCTFERSAGKDLGEEDERRLREGLEAL